VRCDSERRAELFEPLNIRETHWVLSSQVLPLLPARQGAREQHARLWEQRVLPTILRTLSPHAPRRDRRADVIGCLANDQRQGMYQAPQAVHVGWIFVSDGDSPRGWWQPACHHPTLDWPV